MKKHLIIIGFMGTGKSTIGKLLSEQLGLKQIDTDESIERTKGSIKQIFATFGEQAFRDMETETLKQAVSETKPSIITTGGGMVLRKKNREMMQKYGWVFALQAQPDTIINRLSADTSRPLLQGGSLAERVQRLYVERKQAYQFADYQIATDDLSESEVAKQMADIWLNLGKSGDANS
jgi:shikimate kinase